MLVLKFGGTSVGSAASLSQLVSIVRDRDHAGKTAVVVVSALSGITDSLIAAAENPGGGSPDGDLSAMKSRHRELAAAFLTGNDLDGAVSEIDGAFAELSRILDGVAALGELSKRTLDRIMSFGEGLSAPLIARILRSSGVPAEYLDSRKLIVTSDSHGGAHVNEEESYRRIAAAVTGRSDTVFVAPGFIGQAEDGSVTTLGRGGSDLSAAIYGAALDAEGVEIWTDVDGILTADPRLVKNAFRIDSLSYEEAMELSHFGARVLHPPTVRPALEKNIPLMIRNTFNPSSPGT
ncbi:MAG: aspartate kinase, partial [Treponema sp.]|nr:aspartate kinase [Treponema sp.]